jgi:cobalt-precorrin-7 (C5)-methyltransferase
LGDFVKKVRNFKKVFLFTDAKFPPQRIATYLLKKRIRNRRVVVFEGLSYPDERIVDTDLKGLSKMGGFGLCVMLIKKE